MKKHFYKETLFEGYFAACWEYSYLTKNPEYSRRGNAHNRRREWFHKYIEHNLEKSFEAEPLIISLDDMIPRQVFEKLLQNPNTKFRFNIVMEVKEI